jgi:hypothetical protein
MADTGDTVGALGAIEIVVTSIATATVARRLNRKMTAGVEDRIDMVFVVSVVVVVKDLECFSAGCFWTKVQIMSKRSCDCKMLFVCTQLMNFTVVRDEGGIVGGNPSMPPFSWNGAYNTTSLQPT